VTLLAFAAEHDLPATAAVAPTMQQSNDIYCPTGPQQRHVAAS